MVGRALLWQLGVRHDGPPAIETTGDVYAHAIARDSESVLAGVFAVDLGCRCESCVETIEVRSTTEAVTRAHAA
jgi:hypothetical protein